MWIFRVLTVTADHKSSNRVRTNSDDAKLMTGHTICSHGITNGHCDDLLGEGGRIR